MLLKFGTLVSVVPKDMVEIVALFKEEVPVDDAIIAIGLAPDLNIGMFSIICKLPDVEFKIIFNFSPDVKLSIKL